MTKTRTQDIEKLRDNHNRFKKKMKNQEASQEFEKGNQPERSTGRTYLVSKSGEIYKGTENEFWRFNKGGYDERNMQPTTKTSVQPSKERQIEDQFASFDSKETDIVVVICNRKNTGYE